MGTIENKALVRRFYEEVWNRGNLDACFELFTDDWIRHDLRPTVALPGPQGMVNIAGDFRRAFPDLYFAVDLILAEDDLVAARWTAEGTLTGSWGPLAPTGKHARFSGVNILRIRNGRICEMWNHRDDLGLMQQVGAPVYAGAAPGTTDTR